MKNKRNKVAIISRESDDKSLDIRLLEEELLRRGIEVEVLSRLLEKKLSARLLTYPLHILNQQRLIAQSDVLVLDTYCIPASMLPQHKSLITIQMWHALSAVKKFGWQTVGREDGSSERIANLMKMHNGYDKVVCCSDVTADYFCEAFKTDRDKIVKLGLPRIDYILKGDPATVESIYKTYPILRNNEVTDVDEQQNGINNPGVGKRNILYAPTFHKGSPVDVRGLADAIDFERYNLIVKLHPIDRESSERVEREGLIYDDCFGSYDMLKVADIVISDYSSFVVEASLCAKPMYLYTYDVDSYAQTTGLNMNFSEEAIGKYVFRNARELAAAMDESYDYAALEAFRNKYVDIDTTNCTKALADYIESLLDK